jgi:hypothetical protein
MKIKLGRKYKFRALTKSDFDGKQFEETILIHAQSLRAAKEVLNSKKFTLVEDLTKYTPYQLNQESWEK